MTNVVTVDDSVTGTGLGQFEYVGTNWLTGTGTGKYDNDDHYDLTTGESFNFRFDGTQVRYYAATAPHHGIAAIAIDGVDVTTVDLYSSVRVDQVAVFTSQQLAAGSHLFTVRVTGTKNASSTDYVVTVDRIDYASSGTLP